MRSTQIMGVKPEADEFLDENCVMETVQTCDACGHVLSKQRKTVGMVNESDIGLCEDGPICLHYLLKDGSICKEIIQEIPWSNGPRIFMCLEIDGKKKFMWSKKEINNC